MYWKALGLSVWEKKAACLKKEAVSWLKREVSSCRPLSAEQFTSADLVPDWRLFCCRVHYLQGGKGNLARKALFQLCVLTHPFPYSKICYCIKVLVPPLSTRSKNRRSNMSSSLVGKLAEVSNYGVGDTTSCWSFVGERHLGLMCSAPKTVDGHCRHVGNIGYRILCHNVFIVIKHSVLSDPYFTGVPTH